MTPNDEGKLFTPAEAKQLREYLIGKWILPGLSERFEKFPSLRSAGLFVSQFWCDEANDAVHKWMFYSVLENPDFSASFSVQAGQTDIDHLPGLPSDHDLTWNSGCQPIQWDDNGIAIPAFAAFCREGSDQESFNEADLSLFAIFRKTDEGIEIEYVGEMIRPWLDGIAPEFFEEISPDEVSKMKAEYLESFDA